LYTHQGKDSIRKAYQDEAVATKYVEKRFQEPLGALLHARQAGYLKSQLRALSRPQVLELAPGPARLTVEVASLVGTGVMVDTSAEMLAVARNRLPKSVLASWSFIHGDAFNLSLDRTFDLAYSFRLIRHFEDADRKRLYHEIGRLLKPRGLLIFDAVNKVVSEPLRLKNPDGHDHYDALLTPEGIRTELHESGFELVSLTPVQRFYPLLYQLQVLIAPRSKPLARTAMEVVDRCSFGAPLEWIVTCRRM